MQKLQERLKGLVSDVKAVAGAAKEGSAPVKEAAARGGADGKPGASGSADAGPSGSGSAGASGARTAERPRRPPTPKIVQAGPIVPVAARVHARIGLLGNPSDGFYGKVRGFETGLVGFE